ncbi:uncharacterized protein VDAG_04065 [Verticillium dahliae VdLs.17]|uniref:Actin-related protein RO7 n=1 Tax=Verticillium dahliae (strain VdLs.17 / ATCC MYA-4575 / FGSC 10137) TaxID=498257 RepID=G2X1D6_VERDV|nr:uncharacterized protein VDAG_04065 [Verticillium dahliae VdLs.17]EGY22627.1 hypothetical protein VDAG_04065 [Verticillium dahliae VdLs.17]
MSTSAQSATPGLAHRSISNIRSGAGPQAGPASPHTPLRGTTSAFGSPSTLRAEEETIVVEIGTRFVRIGFAGDSVPKAIVSSGPVQQRRVGDFTSWLPRSSTAPSSVPPNTELPSIEWGHLHELWTSDLRCLDLGLVGDKLDRLLRDAFTKNLLIDSRPRRVFLVLPPALPLPLVSTILDTLFHRFQTPLVSILSCPITAAVGAGVRSAIVVNLGWAETVVSSVYEYREIRHTRSTRSGKMLVHEVHDLLASARKKTATPPTQLETSDADGVRPANRVFSFDECEDIACRMMWCQQLDRAAVPEDEPGLATVEERDESTSLAQDESRQHQTVRNVHLGMSSCSPPEIIELPFQRLSEPCENTFVAPQYTPSSFDDDELPIPLLIYRHLLSLPIDARAVSLWGWDPVHGDGAQQVKARAKRSKSQSRAHSQAMAMGEDGQKDDVWHDAANAAPEHDSVQQLLQRTENPLENLQGSVRVLETLGPWAGASMIAHLKAMAVASIDREAWLQQGVAGAARPGEVDVKAQQRQSLGPGLMRGASVGGSASWTLGAWGAV